MKSAPEVITRNKTIAFHLSIKNNWPCRATTFASNRDPGAERGPLEDGLRLEHVMGNAFWW